MMCTCCSRTALRNTLWCRACWQLWWEAMLWLSALGRRENRE